MNKIKEHKCPRCSYRFYETIEGKQVQPSGWGTLPNSKKWHYFSEKQKSLCHQYHTTKDVKTGGFPDPHETCKTCFAALERKEFYSSRKSAVPTK